MFRGFWPDFWHKYHCVDRHACMLLCSWLILIPADALSDSSKVVARYTQRPAGVRFSKDKEVNKLSSNVRTAGGTFVYTSLSVPLRVYRG
jgi:hypothetical protein